MTVNTQADTELFELCKEVYERFPEWKKTGHWFFEQDNQPGLADQKWLPTITCDSEAAMHNDYPYFEAEVCPLYTSDYLLEKLPRKIHRDAWLNLYPMDRGGNDWGASYDTDNDENLGFVFADTPLKALLKLTLALHESGELK